jgi:hypothetical protein
LYVLSSFNANKAVLFAPGYKILQLSKRQHTQVCQRETKLPAINYSEREDENDKQRTVHMTMRPMPTNFLTMQLTVSLHWHWHCKNNERNGQASIRLQTFRPISSLFMLGDGKA